MAAVSRIPITTDPAQVSGAASADSAKPGANGQDFAAALSNAGPKPARKPASNKAHDGGSTGGQLPVPGKHSPSRTSPSTPSATPAPAPPATPPATAPVTAALVAAPSAATTAGVIVSGTAAIVASPVAATIANATAKAADPNAGSALLGPPAAASANTASANTASASPGAAFAQALGLPLADPNQRGVPGGSGAAVTATLAPIAQGTIAAGAAAPTVLVNATRDSGAAQAVAATEGHAAANGAAAAAGTAASTVGAGSAATSGSSTSGGSATTPTPTDTSPSTDGNATAQTATAVAMSAAAAGAASSVAAAAQSSSPRSDKSASPAAGSVAQDAGGPGGAPVPALAVSGIHSAAAAAATAAANAQAVTAPANARAADKHAFGGTGDSLLSGASGDSAAGAAQLSVNTASVTDATPTPTLKVTAGVDTPEFGQGLADRVSWMVDNNLNGAKLQVNPPQLGPIEVRIAVQGSHAEVWLTSHSAVTRDALESSSPKLREMLGAQGFGQVSVDISHRSFQERSAHSQPYDWTPSANRGPSAAAVQSSSNSLPRTSSGAVDTYA